MWKRIAGPLFIFILLTGRISHAQEWFEPSLKISNKTADTSTYDPDLHQLLVYYQRLAETEPHLWVAYYYLSFINLKLAVNSADQKIKKIYLDKAYSLASLCMLNYEKNTEIRALYAIVTVQCIDAGIMDMPTMQEQIKATLDTSSHNPRMLIAYSGFLLENAEKNRNMILLIEPRLSALLASAEEIFKGDAYTPSWGVAEIKQTYNTIRNLK
jgi:hypothetical protein